MIISLKDKFIFVKFEKDIFIFYIEDMKKKDMNK